MATLYHLPYLIRQCVHVRLLEPYLRQLHTPDRQRNLLIWLDQVPSLTYQQSVLCRFIQMTEAHTAESTGYVDEEVYERYGMLMLEKAQAQNQASNDDQLLVTYSGPGHSVSVQIYEEPNIIAKNGTTGNRTWEAAIALASYFVDDSYKSCPLISDFAAVVPPVPILELGSGTGLVGMVLAKLGHYVTLTDGDSSVTESLSNLVIMNNLKHMTQCRQLLWGPEAAGQISPSNDLWVIGADITYDSTYFQDLAATLRFFVPNIIISCTIRSETTHKALVDAFNEKGMSMLELKKYPRGGGIYSMGLIMPESPEIVIYRLVKKDYVGVEEHYSC